MPFPFLSWIVEMSFFFPYSKGSGRGPSSPFSLFFEEKEERTSPPFSSDRL